MRPGSCKQWWAAAPSTTPASSKPAAAPTAGKAPDGGAPLHGRLEVFGKEIGGGDTQHEPHGLAGHITEDDGLIHGGIGEQTRGRSEEVQSRRRIVAQDQRYPQHTARTGRLEVLLIFGPTPITVDVVHQHRLVNAERFHAGPITQGLFNAVQENRFITATGDGNRALASVKGYGAFNTGTGGTAQRGSRITRGAIQETLDVVSSSHELVESLEILVLPLCFHSTMLVSAPPCRQRGQGRNQRLMALPAGIISDQHGSVCRT